MNLYEITYSTSSGEINSRYAVAETAEIAMLLAEDEPLIGENIEDIKIIEEDILIQEPFEEDIC